MNWKCYFKQRNSNSFSFFPFNFEYLQFFMIFWILMENDINQSEAWNGNLYRDDNQLFVYPSVNFSARNEINISFGSVQQLQEKSFLIKSELFLNIVNKVIIPLSAVPSAFAHIPHPLHRHLHHPVMQPVPFLLILNCWRNDGRKQIIKS